MKRRILEFLYRLLQLTWGLPQTLAGAVVTLIFAKYPHFRYQGAIGTVWPLQSSMSLGMFLFLYDGWTPDRPKLLRHEYGHTIQSLLLGPTYLLVIGIPSIFWAGFGPVVRMRARKNIPYSWLYTERWADYNGKRFAKAEAKLHEKTAL